MARGEGAHAIAPGQARTPAQGWLGKRGRGCGGQIRVGG
ncbi:Hypothetical protein CAP_4970 [Chondromyces apiculatus DSM 436]|uniref:Uncharacterized protein n=1 Tax=Chondromyces apiculatus DSM 436 TaxID=1192034 RepID=A0A017TGH9_9BACT|nr:Hypothetical protein CAP_4970 [Chondromyces apiculatus DSM 436]